MEYISVPPPPPPAINTLLRYTLPPLPFDLRGRPPVQIPHPPRQVPTQWVRATAMHLTLFILLHSK